MAPGRSMLALARTLDPGSFAAIMATGIVSVDASQHGMPWLAQALFALNLVMFASLCAISALRFVRFRDALIADFVDPGSAAGFLTFVAGTCVLAVQCLIVVHVPVAALVLGVVGAIAWVVLVYAFFATMIARRVKHGLARSIHGGWLVVIVATQSVAVLAFLLSADNSELSSETQRVLLFSGLCLHLIGAALYLLIITLVFYRMVFLPMRARDFRPTYWINMGALAISTLAGSLFILHVPSSGPLADLVPFVKGFTLFFWATASWWIPLLLLLELWRHAWKRIPLRYEVDDWDIVFPIAMYTVGTFELAHALQLDFLLAIPTVGVYVSLLVWAIVALAWLVRSSPRPDQSIAPSRR
ncbi:MAG TPA: tellurite resistance/C4-dicarboxylate transporter family protein [Dokdonella sp.]|uniref:tellurite resistance/C4-dicarboxylate transporter family protein n=1 Tax=Dokdonella sp. TaxID=2291710 RepID=UPI002D7F4250|nr:tellurite resistance/C4-dicarboxylate transporter family protein [Dokdonella sp.]HET9031818.1 tellurite resistance/C4-dicarboxylate transporter family protein [Dokdonella sp.]